MALTKIQPDPVVKQMLEDGGVGSTVRLDKINPLDIPYAGRTRFTQVSLFSVLLSGRYGGVISVGELKKLGNMAIATMDRLDGEMQMIDGVVYQACADGHVYRPGDDATVPFGTIAEFHAERTVKLSDVPSYEEFEARMNELCPAENVPLAIHFAGAFSHMKVRAVARLDSKRHRRMR